jgi:hypothetical protein
MNKFCVNCVYHDTNVWGDHWCSRRCTLDLVTGNRTAGKWLMLPRERLKGECGVDARYFEAKK